MEVCNLPRGRGKSTYLIYRSHVTPIPILCMNQTHVENIKDMARRLDITIPEPIAVVGYLNENKRPKPERLLVDEALYVLREVLNADIDTVTLTEYERRY